MHVFGVWEEAGVPRGNPHRHREKMQAHTETPDSWKWAAGLTRLFKCEFVCKLKQMMTRWWQSYYEVLTWRWVWQCWSVPSAARSAWSDDWSESNTQYIYINHLNRALWLVWVCLQHEDRPWPCRAPVRCQWSSRAPGPSASQQPPAPCHLPSACTARSAP